MTDPDPIPPPDTPENRLIRWFIRMGYDNLRQLPTGEWAGTQQMMFTAGLVVGLGTHGYRTRFCYPTMDEAVTALRAWNGAGWPPGYWIKQKPEDVHGPGSTDKFAKKVP